MSDDCASRRCRSVVLLFRDQSLLPKAMVDVANGGRATYLRLRSLADELLKVLVDSYEASVTLPRNVRLPDEFRLLAWPDIVDEQLGLYGLILYSWFPFSIFKKDHKSEYEPLEIVFHKSKDGYRPIYAYGRVHYDICEYRIDHLSRIDIMYFFHGHTPFIDGVGYVRVLCPKTRSSKRKVGRRYWNRIWLASGKIFLKATRPFKVSLSRLASIGVLKVMECPDDGSVNLVRSIIRPLYINPP